MKRKPLVWVGSSLEVVRAMPRGARATAGRALLRVQFGLAPVDSKPLPMVGSGVVEIRLHVGQEYRVVYVAKFAEAVYVLHVFEKRTERTRQGDLELARSRLRQVERARREAGSRAT